MPRRLFQRIAIAGFALTLLLGPLGTAMATQTPAGFHWARGQSQFTLQMGTNISGGWNSLVREAVSEWNRNDTVTLREVTGAANPQTCPPTTGKVEVCNWLYGTQEGWLGLTRLFFNDRGDHVDAATVQMNDSFFDQNTGQYNSDAARRHTICHELGHSIGLDHVDTDSCMNDSQQAVFNNLTPTNQDFNELARIYEHTDSTSTVAGSQKNEKDNKKGKNDKKDGKKKKKKRNQENTNQARNERAGPESFFEPTSLPSVLSGLATDETVTVQTLDDGRKMVTFITWAEE